MHVDPTLLLGGFGQVLEQGAQGALRATVEFTSARGKQPLAGRAALFAVLRASEQRQQWRQSTAVGDALALARAAQHL